MDELYYKAKYESLIAENKIPKNNWESELDIKMNCIIICYLISQMC